MPQSLHHTIIFLFFWFAYALIPAAAQTTDTTSIEQEINYDTLERKPVKWTSTPLENYRKDSAFDYREAIPQDNWWTRFNAWINGLWNSFIQWILNGREAQGLLKFFIQALPYIIIIAILVFLGWLFIRIDLQSSPVFGGNVSKLSFSDEEQLIKNEDLEQLIEQAVAQNNFRLAIRYYYLFTLKQLSKHNLIDWQTQKTNHDYIHEIGDPTIKNQFIKLTRIYDFIWYGNFEVDDPAFAKAKQEFLKISGHL